MSYIPTKWLDHIIDEKTGEIMQEGTPVSALNLNNIEQGIIDIRDIAQMFRLTLDNGSCVRFEGSLNNLLEPGDYYIALENTDKPFNITQGLCILRRITDTNGWIQIVYSTGATPITTYRYNNLGVWTNWRKVSNREEVILWSGAVNAPNTTITLADEISNYDYIEFYGYYFGSSEMLNKSYASNSSFDIRQLNLSDDESALGLSVGECVVTKIDAKTLTITHNYQWNWYGLADRDATKNSAGVLTIQRIVGVKN